MKTTATVLAASCLVFAASAMAQTAMKKDDAMMKDGMAKPMTMQECKDHMAMMKKDTSVKKDDAMMKKDTTCSDMMKKDDAMMKKDDAMMKKDGMAKDAPKK